MIWATILMALREIRRNGLRSLLTMLGVVIGLAMVGNMIAAGIAGTLVPLTLRFFKLDPALASAVMVTTVTDCVGFGLFLGLATLFLPYLL